MTCNIILGVFCFVFLPYSSLISFKHSGERSKKSPRMLEKHPRIYEEVLREQGMFILAKRDRVDVTVYRYIKG